MKLIPIFDVPNIDFYSIQYTEEDSSEWHRLFELWRDVEYLEGYFEEHKYRLGHKKCPYKTVDEAVVAILDDAFQLRKQMLELAKATKKGYKPSLDSKFNVLDRADFGTGLTAHKAYGALKKSLLRIYAVRIGDNAYVVTGGAIKIWQTMQESEYTMRELRKLQRVKDYLREMEIFEDGDDI